ncbi:MAG TPA: hypothetical protein VIK60_04295 [Vicinamibacterales bacterium]
MAAQGVLGLRRFEQVAVCELLANDADVEVAREAAALLRTLNSEAQDTAPDAGSTVPDDEPEEGSALQRIAAMSPAQRLARAMKGTREERAILVRDPNRIVAVAVLSSPKVTQAEVESIAKMANVSEDILRIIGNTRAWLKNYAIVSALTKNSKTPVGVSLNLLSRLLEKDVKALSTDRNIPEPLRLAARRKLVPS